MSCSDLLGLYQRTASHQTVGSAGAARGRAAMASWLGVPLPVVQGPMTRVSDGSAFARAVVDAGAMPVIAAAMLPADRLGRILHETADLCGDHPWGVGLLAFRPQADLQPQIEQVLRARPDLIVLAGGNPLQISQFGDLAERVVIHSPTPELFERQLREGCRRFILEGRECGGHTGPCSSLSLWEGCLRVLASQPRLVREETSILFAGGIHSARSTSNPSSNCPISSPIPAIAQPFALVIAPPCNPLSPFVSSAVETPRSRARTTGISTSLDANG